MRKILKNINQLDEFLLWIWRRFYYLCIPPLVLMLHCGPTCRSRALRCLLVAELKCKRKSIIDGFFRKNLIFFNPYIGIKGIRRHHLCIGERGSYLANRLREFQSCEASCQGRKKPKHR